MDRGLETFPLRLEFCQSDKMSCDLKQHGLSGQGLHNQQLHQDCSWCLDDPELAAKVCLHLLQIYSGPTWFIRHLLFGFNDGVQRDNLHFKTVDLLLFSQSVEVCAEGASYFYDFFSQLCPFLCQFFDLFSEFRVPLGI